MAYSAEVLLDSESPRGARLTTMVVTFPRIILAEFNTHRAFSRNSASSRAIPVEKQIARVLADPFVPEQWGSNKKGMQAGENLDATSAVLAMYTWRSAAERACQYARQLATTGVHKQLVNRLLEPYMWHTVIVSSTTWSNFFKLRCHPDAQPEMQKIACMMRDALEASKPGLRSYHRPFCPEELGTWTWGDVKHNKRQANMVSAARCARVSYLGHDGSQDLAADLALAERLAASGHLSPFEHVAYAKQGPQANFNGWRQVRADLEQEQGV